MSNEYEEYMSHNRILFLTDEIDKDSCSFLIKQILTLSEEDPKEDILLCINSAGGNVSEGLGLIDVMKAVKPKIYTLAMSNVISMALTVYVCGDYRYALPHTTFLYHPMVMDLERGYTVYDMVSTSSYFKIFQESCNDILRQHTKFSDEYIHVREDQYFGSKEAKKLGCVDRIISSFPMSLSTLRKDK